MSLQEKETRIESSPLVSVIIPCYNMAAYLPKSIRSVLAQTHENIEVLIIDDESIDDSFKIATDFANKHSNVRVLSLNHGGVSKAMNYGSKLCSGKYFLSLGADDTLDEHYVEECLRVLIADTSVGFVWTGSLPFGETSHLSTYGIDCLLHPRKLTTRWSILRNPCGQTGAAMFLKEAFLKVGGYDERLEIAEDWDLVIRLRFAGWKGVSIDKPLHHYRFHSPNQRSRTLTTYSCLERKYPLMKPYNILSRVLEFGKLLAINPSEGFNRLKQKGKRSRSIGIDEAESERVDERLTFGLDIGSGANKLLGIGCDIRKVTDVQCDMRHLPFKDKAFLIAALRHSLEHVPEWRLALFEAKRVACTVYVILPKRELWFLDPTHISPFKLDGGVPIRYYSRGECYKLDS